MDETTIYKDKETILALGDLKRNGNNPHSGNSKYEL